MDTGTVVSILGLALVIVVLLFLLRAAGVGRRRPRLRPLSAESRERFIQEWDEIEAKFVDSPEQAVREAEALVMSVLRERGHPLTERDLPAEVQKAHRLAYTSRDKTEAMRQAMLHYQALMERMIGAEHRTRPEARKPEIAS